jgi:hypothetical protein
MSSCRHHTNVWSTFAYLHAITIRRFIISANVGTHTQVQYGRNVAAGEDEVERLRCSKPCAHAEAVDLTVCVPVKMGGKEVVVAGRHERESARYGSGDVKKKRTSFGDERSTRGLRGVARCMWRDLMRS